MTEFADFYSESKDLVLQAIVAVTGDLHRAEDAAAEAFARAFANWDKVSGHPVPTAWVIRTGLNFDRSWWRRLRRETADPPEKPAAVNDEGLSEELRQLVWELPRRQREVIALRLILGLTTRETADALRIAEGTVTAHLHRGVTALRSALAEVDRLSGGRW